jgi:hypothetical protein
MHLMEMSAGDFASNFFLECAKQNGVFIAVSFTRLRCVMAFSPSSGQLVSTCAIGRRNT